MSTDRDYTQYVMKAKQGDRSALNDLADRVEPHLLEYVMRMTMDTHLAQDLVQESLLTMVQEYDRLRDPRQFWFWLTKIALNHVRAHYRRNWRRVSLSRKQPPPPEGGVHDAVAEVIGEELKQIVLRAMHRLPPEHRAVLAMRCYDQLTFPLIAKQLGCREFQARALFSRAKRALGKNLTKNGLGKASLLGALVIFGKITAVTEATVTDTSVAAAALDVGFWPSLAVALSSRAAATIIATLGVSVAAVPLVSGIYDATGVESVDSASVRNLGDSQGQENAHEYQYYFPPGHPGVVHIQTRASDEDKRTDWRWLQNADANFWCNGKQVFIKNSHLVLHDLAVLRLPTDSSGLKAFLDRVESRHTTARPVRLSHTGLLVIMGTNVNGPFTHVRSDYDISDEQVFQRPWPTRMKVIDERDALHQQGWCCFRITGSVRGKRIQGTGRIPLVLSALSSHFPWLTLSVGQDMVLVDDPTGAHISKDGLRKQARYAPGAFFRALSRPWEGLHTLDTIRRDAAHYRLWFETQRIPHTQQVTVTVIQGEFRIVYTVEMDTDLVREIQFFEGQIAQGQLSIDYLKDGKGSIDVTEPKLIRRRPTRHKPLDTLWMLNLMKEAWD